MSRILDERDKQNLESNISTTASNINMNMMQLKLDLWEKDSEIVLMINEHEANVRNPHRVTYAQVGADPTGSAAKALSDSKTYTDNKLAELVDSAPETLNTLDELAAALNDDSNFAATMATELGKKTNNTDFTAHTSNVSNPHQVTATQVGLGNVPNVATNDQTPTYTEASTLSTIVSGEKLSVSFGKIMKAITDLISHISNKSNPHGVTVSQIGADSSGSAAQALSDAKGYTDTKISDISSDTSNKLNNKVDKDGNKVLTDNNLTNALKSNYDAAYNHSISAHAPSDAEKNVQVDWNIEDTSSDEYIKNKPTSMKNPNKLILTGSVNATYDGSTEITVNIPRGGDGTIVGELCTTDEGILYIG